MKIFSVMSLYTTIIATLFALLAFAGNSVLGRMALGEHAIDAGSFTIIRLISGSIALFFIVQTSQFYKRSSNSKIALNTTAVSLFSWRYWRAPFMLFLYAACFSYAYIQLDTGVGALILFGAVQLSMIAVSIYAKETLHWHKMLGVLLAFCGLCFLVWSQVDWTSAQISIEGFVLMLVGGIAWAAYTIFGSGSREPLLLTYRNFYGSVVFCIPLTLVYLWLPAVVTEAGFYLALASGIVTSAMGYAVWYLALNGLTRIQAGVLQLLVPVIAAIGGLIWVSEPIGLDLVIAQGMILGGILLVLVNRRNK